MAKATRQNAVAAYTQDTAALTLREQQEQEAAAQRKLDQQREYRSAAATAEVAAEDAGVTGLSVDALLSDLAGQQAGRQKATDKNLAMAVAQLQSEKAGAAVARDSRVNTARDPSLAALLIDVGGTAVRGFDSYQSRTNPNWRK